MTTEKNHTRAEKLLLEAARTFNSTLEYEELVERVLRLVIAAAGSEAALIFRIDHERTDMKIRFMRCTDPVKHDAGCTECPVRVFQRELGQGVVGWVANYREPVIINDTANDPRVDLELGLQGGIQIRSVITVPLIGKGHMIGVIEAINKIEGEFTDADLDVLIGLANQIAVAIDNAHLYRAVKREVLEKELLYEIGIKLSSSLSLDELMREILSTLKEAISYDGAGIYVLNPETNSIESLHTVGFDEHDEAKHIQIGHGLIGATAQTGDPIIVADVAADTRYVSARPTTRSEIVVPITLDGRVIGVINLESDRHNAYDRRDHSLMSAFASQAAISIERARLHDKLLESQKLEGQLRIAREIQQSFLPDDKPQIVGYDVAGINIPSFQVGGDYYDFIRIVESQTGIAIADVSGKGIPAALIMASFRASLIAEIRNNYSIRTICQKVNNLMYESIRAGTFVTAVYGVLDSKNHVLTFANCGHNLPVLLRRDGSVEFLREGGLVMGIAHDAVYEERPLYLNPGEIVLLYTDGISEVFDAADEEFGLDHLISVLRENQRRSATEIQDAVLAAVRSYASPEHVYDDLTLIVIKRLS